MFVGVCQMVCLFVNVCWAGISRKRSEIQTRLQWSTYKEMAHGESNGHVIESRDGGLAEVYATWVIFL